MNNELICGLDVASTSARAALLPADSSTQRELDLPATREGENTLLRALPPDSIVILESTGRYHLRWARRLEAAGHRVYVLNALLAQRLASSVKALRDNKTDPIDARHLAHIGRLHLADLQTYRFQENPARCACANSARCASPNANCSPARSPPPTINSTASCPKPNRWASTSRKVRVSSRCS